MIVFGVNSLGNVFKQVSWSIVLNESSEAFAYAFNCICAAFFSLFKNGAARLCERGSESNFGSYVLANYNNLLSPSRPSQSDQAVDAHTANIYTEIF